MQIQISLISSIPNIESLTLRGVELIGGTDIIDFTPLTKLHHLDLEDTIKIMPLVPSTIKRLNLAGNCKLGTFPWTMGTHQKLALPELPLLEVLDCQQTSLEDSSVAALISPSVKRGNLRSLSMGELPRNGSERETPTELPRSEKLETLSLCFGPYRTEDQIIDIVTLYPNLRKLDVAGCPVTGFAIKQFVGMGIQWLDLRWCRDVRSEDVKFARANGVHVVYTMGYSQSNSQYPTMLRDSCFRLAP